MIRIKALLNQNHYKSAQNVQTFQTFKAKGTEREKVQCPRLNSIENLGLNIMEINFHMKP